MRNTILTFAMSTLIAGGLSSALSGTARTMATTSVSQRDTLNEEYRAYKAEADAKIRRNEARIAELKAKIARDKSKMKAEYHEQLAALEAKNNKLKNKLAAYKASGKEHWYSFKREFTHDMDELGRSLKDFTVNNSK